MAADEQTNDETAIEQEEPLLSLPIIFQDDTDTVRRVLNGLTT